MTNAKINKKFPKYLSIRNGKWVVRNPYTKPRKDKTLKLIYDGTKSNEEKAIRLRDEHLKYWIVKDEALNKEDALEKIHFALQEQKERLKKYKQNETKDILLSEATKRCFRERWSKNATGKEVVKKMEVLIDKLGDPKLSEITSEDLYDVRDKLEEDRSSASVNRYMAAIKTVLNMAMKRWRILPFVIYIPLTKEVEGRIRYITPEEEEKIYDLLRNRKMSKFTHQENNYINYIDLLIYLIDTGCRNRSEALKQMTDDINLKKREIHIWKNKSDEPRTIAMTKRVYEICKNRKNNIRLFEDFNYTTLKRVWQFIRDELEITDKDFVLHCLRHSCCTRLWQRGVDPKTIMVWMGHSKLETTLRYAHLNADSLHNAAKVLDQ